MYKSLNVKECYISDCEDNNIEDQDSVSEHLPSSSSSDNEQDDDWLTQVKETQPFDPTKITTSIPLLPFKNQVGGHAPFFRFSKRAICKPVSAKEQAFYEHIDAKHHELLPFTSQYMGVLNVTYRSNNGTPVPEVLFEKNKHLLQHWQECSSNRRRHSCTPGSHPTNDSFYKQCRSHARRKFQERVLREVFSPKALKERLLLAEDWKPKPDDYYLDTRAADIPYSNTLPYHRIKCWGDENPIAEGGRSVPIMTGLAFKSKVKLNGESRRPSTTSLLSLAATDDDIFPMDDDDDFQKKPIKNIPILHVDSASLKEADDQPAVNPWSLQIYNRDLQRMKNNNKDPQNSVQKYILIEDLTDGVRYPCVLDLKMGTRQYGVYATRDKMRSQTIKCEKSTSKVLGVRVCGLQVCI
jgi:hypothetical protein